MLPAFRVKGLWPKQNGLSLPENHHPVTGVRLPKFEAAETILQLPKNRYDDLVKANPEYRLKYLDEDKDEITIGSEQELSQKLEEPLPHGRLVKASEDPRFYTSIPECMHGFHLTDNEEARSIWNFLGTATRTRNVAAHKLWTSPRVESTQDVQALLNQHSYEFMKGYDFEGFNSHYNYLSDAGQQLKDIAAQSMLSKSQPIYDATELAGTQQNASPLDPIESTLADWKDLVGPTPNQQPASLLSLSKHTVLPTMEEMKQKTVSLNAQLDEQLASARAVTRSLDGPPAAQPSSSQYITFKQLNDQLQIAKETTSNFAASTHSDKSSDKASRGSITTSHLTVAGKQASQEAGEKLRDQLFGIPKQHSGASKDDVHRWMAYSRDPPASVAGTSAPMKTLITETSGSPVGQGDKKTVRFSLANSPRGTFNLDGSYSPGTSSISMPTASAALKTDDEHKEHSRSSAHNITLSDPLPQQKPQDVANTPEPRLSTEDIIKIQQLLKTMDEVSQTPEAKNELGRLYRDNVRKSGIILKEPLKPASRSRSSKDETHKIAPNSSTIAEPVKILRTDNKHQPDTPETMVSKLWCQTLENITANIQTFTDQVDGAAFTQMDKELTRTAKAFDSYNCSAAPEDQTRAEECLQSIDNITEMRRNLESLINRLRKWTTTSEALLSAPNMFDDQGIDISRIRRTFESLIVLKDEVEAPFASIYKTFAPCSGNIPDNAFDAWHASHHISSEVHWKPQRFTSDKKPSEVESSSSPVTSANKQVETKEPLQDPSTAIPCVPQAFGTSEQSKQNTTISAAPPATPVRFPSLQDMPMLQGNPQSDRWTLDHFPALVPSRPDQQPVVPSPSTIPANFYRSMVPSSTYNNKLPQSNRSTSIESPSNKSKQEAFPTRWDPYAGLSSYSWNQAPQVALPASLPKTTSKTHPQTEAENTSGSDQSILVPKPLLEQLTQSIKTLPDLNYFANWPNPASQPEILVNAGTKPLDDHDTVHNTVASSIALPSLPAQQSITATSPGAGLKGEEKNRTPQYLDITSTPASFHDVGEMFTLEHTYPDTSSTAAQPSESEVTMPGSFPSVEEANTTPQIELFQDIPEHSNPRTATKIRKCVEALKDLGYGNSANGGEARLVVYAQAARGDVNRAVDIITEEQEFYQQKADEFDELYN